MKKVIVSRYLVFMDYIQYSSKKYLAIIVIYLINKPIPVQLREIFMSGYSTGRDLMRRNLLFFHILKEFAGSVLIVFIMAYSHSYVADL